MTGISDDSKSNRINRRRALQALSVAAVGGLAGCAEDGDPDAGNGNGNGSGNGNGDARGERVPTLDLTYWSNVDFVPISESMLPIIQEDMAELGIDVNLRPTEFTTEITEQLEGSFTRHLQLWYYTSDPGRLDPNPMLERFFGDRAGDTGTLNTANYINCDYTTAGYRQQNIADEDERREVVLDAQRTIAEDAVISPLSPVINAAAVRTDEVDVDGVGEMGIILHNPNFYIKSSPINSDTITIDVGPVTLETSHYQVIDSTPSLSFWNKLISSTLVEWTENSELVNLLAEEITFEENGERVVVELRDDAQFQNGDPITAEDVQFTFEYLWERPGQFPQLEVPPYEDIEVTDELTTEFTFSRPYAPLLTRNWSTWGILHKESWIDMGALEQDTLSPDEDLIGSGPFEIIEFSEGERLILDPVDTHPVHKPDHRLVAEAFRDFPPKSEAFRANEIQVMINIPIGVQQDLEAEMADTVDTFVAEGYLCWGIFHNYPVAPSKFKTYRQAVGRIFDRELINEVAFYGQSYEPMQSTVFMRNHPYRPPEGEVYDFGDDTSGDVETAREMLEDDGWSWDDDGNLRYPEGMDLDPLWPDGERPDPADYPCLDEEGNFQFPD